jgi:hypothetical protein
MLKEYLMKQLYWGLLLIALSIPLSSAKQSLELKVPSVTGNIVQVLQQIEQELSEQNLQTLTVSWLKAEGEWQKLFAEVSEPALNKTYNQLQVSYLVFRQKQDVRMFRTDIDTALQALRYR